jgi:hypothetical protein
MARTNSMDDVGNVDRNLPSSGGCCGRRALKTPADAVELKGSFDVNPRVWTHQEDSSESPALKRQVGTIPCMAPFAATRRRPERTSELVKKVDETFVPRLSKLPGFSGY